MTWMITTGAILTLLGISVLVYCILLALRAKRAGLGDEEMKQRLQRVVAINMGGLFVSAIGLMLVVVGVILT